ncbi:adenine phosphoribosyltransferase [Arsenicicoccus sp. oral taxon 190]|uniref:adenine phosphoribosyltransferase n=1 Tax=Arsenicicoccus sp. oral taxon 190 TaxID=1658671 RepID=UPI000679EA8B|nr:adenine phosphoribosyltransferase [Arsenicicoccus sp. oral taxon 190]AKT52810.1 adenine phosphoribosyltransferase [Arsenicicoccus sp. oral taxon 190]
MRDVPDFPAPGVLFKDFTPLLADGAALRRLVDDVARRYRGRCDVVVGMEARGFILGAAVAYALEVGFVPVRKAGKLPGGTVSVDYTLEYASATLEMHADALHPGQRVLVLDDVLATGGTAAATCRLVEECGAVVAACEFVVEIDALGGRSQLAGREVTSLVHA